MKSLLLFTFCGLFISCGSTENSTDHGLEKELVVSDTVQVDTSGVLTETEDTKDEDFIVFGIADEAGKHIKILNGFSEDGSGIDPETFKHVIGKSGELLSVDHLGKTDATDQDTYRQTPYNFENLAGELYKVNGTVEAWNSVVLMHPNFTSKRELLLPLEGKSTIFNHQDALIIQENHPGWYMETAENISTYSGGISTHFIKYENKGDSALVSFVLKSDELGMVYYDFPAIYDETSTWRVDDGGQFNFDLFRVLAVFIKDGSPELFTDWVGAEGTNVYYMKAAGNGFFKVEKRAYFYQAPL